ncbi:MAG: hypothetical protein KKF67_02155 [Nanoarchaeota archaeon]|nr:hypothetical protein [Nanoarchaeota archaeon]
MKIRRAFLLKYKDKLTKELLEEEYIKKKKSILQLQKELNKDWHTIKYYLNLNKIPLRTHKEQATISSPGGKYKHLKILTKSFLTREYLTNKKSISLLSRESKIDRTVLLRYLRMHNIVVRSIKEQKNLDNPPKEFKIKNEVKSFIDGLLLGDASIPKRKNRISPRSLTQACKHKEYLEYVSKRLFKMEIICSPILSRWIKDDRCKNKGYNQHFLQTRRYKTFEIFRDRLYPNDNKIIPKDIGITRDLMLQLYLCDGNFYRHITLCLNAFSKQDIVFLKKKIEEKIGIQLSLKKQKEQFMLVIKRSDSQKFLSYIGLCPVSCYQYKWIDNESEEIKERKRLKAKIKYHNRKCRFL